MRDYAIWLIMVLGNDDLFDEITMKIGQVTCKECSWLRIVMHRPNPIFLFDISRCLLDLNSNCKMPNYTFKLYSNQSTKYHYKLDKVFLMQSSIYF